MTAVPFRARPVPANIQAPPICPVACAGFRVFDLVLSTSNPGLGRTRWTHDGVEFERERHSFTGPKHGLTIEIFTLTRGGHGGRRGWSLMVTKEYWWAGPDNRAFKNLHWARPVTGQRIDMLNWMRAQEAALERSFALSRGSKSSGNGDEPQTVMEILTLEDDEGL